LLRRVRHTFEQDVRVGLEPDRFAEASGLWWRWRLLRWRWQFLWLPTAVAERIEAAVRRDPVQLRT
jgi:hypothetical protein